LVVELLLMLQFLLAYPLKLNKKRPQDKIHEKARH